MSRTVNEAVFHIHQIDLSKVGQAVSPKIYLHKVLKEIKC